MKRRTDLEVPPGYYRLRTPRVWHSSELIVVECDGRIGVVPLLVWERGQG